MTSQKVILIIFICTGLVMGVVSPGFAAWVWTPETNKWINPKYAVKDTPSEQLQYALDFYKTQKYKEAMAEFRKLIRHYPRAREAADAQYYIGACWEGMANFPEAFKNYQEVIDKYPFSERSGEIVQKQYDLAVQLLEGRDKEGVWARTFAGTDYTAIDMFKAVIKNAPYGPLAPPARYKIGLYLLENALYQEARDEFEKVMNDYPESEWATAAKYQIAFCDSKRSTGAPYDQKITQTAVKEFKDFVENYPDAELSPQAKDQIQQLRDKEAESNFHIARFYEKNKKYESARIYYQKIVDEFQNSRWTAPALNKIRELSALSQKIQ